MRWYVEPVRDFRKTCEVKVRIETALIWMSLGLAIGGALALSLFRFYFYSNAQHSLRSFALEMATPGTWIFMIAGVAIVSYLIARPKLKRLFRKIYQQEEEIRSQVEVANGSTKCQSTMREIAKYALIQQKLSALNEDLECYNVDNDLRDEVERAVSRMAEIDIWRLVSDSDVTDLIRAVPRQLRRASLLSDRYNSRLRHQIASLSAPRCDLRLHRAPSGRITVGWAQEEKNNEPADDSVLIHPAWTVLSSSIAPAVRSLGIVKEMINLLDHLDFTKTTYLGLIELPDTGNKTSEGRYIKTWTRMKRAEQNTVLSMMRGTYDSGLARIYTNWTTRDVTLDVSIEDIRAVFSEESLYIQRPERATDRGPRLGPVFDTDPGRLCVIDNELTTDTAILSMYRVITPVFRRVVKEGLVPVDADPSVAVPVRVGDAKSRLYYIDPLIDF